VYFGGNLLGSQGRRCRERIHHQQGKRMNCFCTCNRSAPG
jgi:hypothetical protein